MTRSAMVASTLGVEFVSDSSVLFWPPCRTNFCLSATTISVLLLLGQGHFLAIPGIEGAKHLDCRG